VLQGELTSSIKKTAKSSSTLLYTARPSQKQRELQRWKQQQLQRQQQQQQQQQ